MEQTRVAIADLQKIISEQAVMKNVLKSL